MATSYDPCGHELAREHMLVALYPWVRRRMHNTPRSRDEVDGALSEDFLMIYA